MIMTKEFSDLVLVVSGLGDLADLLALADLADLLDSEDLVDLLALDLADHSSEVLLLEAWQAACLGHLY